MKQKLKSLEDHVSALANQKPFVHQQWFVAHHLKIMEQLAQQLFAFYPQADQDMVMALIWLHDLGKIITNQQIGRDEEIVVMLQESKILLDKFEFPADFTQQVLKNLDIFEQAKTLDMTKENIETQIAVTVDGCSHFAFPGFMGAHWQENAHLDAEELIGRDRRKAIKDWEYKIILPEARKAFEPYVRYFMDYDPHNLHNYFTDDKAQTKAA